MQDRVDAHVLAGRKLRAVLVPELRWLVRHVPLGVPAALTEKALLGPRALFVAPDSHDDAGEPVLGDHLLQPFRLQGAAADEAAARVVHAVRKGGGVLPHDELEAELARDAIAVGDHRGNLVRGVDVDEREGRVAEEGLAREP
jgi:hypothetical protein